MSKILLQNTLNSPSELCFVAPYSGILQSLDVDVDESFLYCYCGGVDFKYGYIHDYKWTREYICEQDTISIEGSRDIKNTINESFGINFKEILCENIDYAVELIKYQLMKGKKVICFADVFFLTYHPQYHKKHGQTILTIWDYDSKTNTFIISDRHVTTIPVSSYLGPLNMFDFDRALICGDNVFDGKKTGIIIYDDFISQRLEYINFDERFVKVAREMLSNSDILAGVKGITTFGKDVVKWGDQWAEGQLKEVFNSAYKHIMGRGGPYISRKVYAEFMSQKYNDLAIGDLFSEVAKEWHSLSVKFFRNTIDVKKNSLESISGLIYEIAEAENEIYNFIINKLER